MDPYLLKQSLHKDFHYTLEIIFWRNTMRSFAGRDILSLKNFRREEYFRVFEAADRVAPFARDRQTTDLLADKILVTAFYQPSTRTRLATESAMLRLGGKVTGFSDAKMTRAGDFYQESIKDTVNMLEYYGDVIAMRHFQQGAPAEAADWASVPVINCGDGWGEHPTQVLTDMYTIYKDLGRLDGLHFVLVGDMRMRTMHSLSYAMTQFGGLPGGGLRQSLQLLAGTGDHVQVGFRYADIAQFVDYRAAASLVR